MDDETLQWLWFLLIVASVVVGIGACRLVDLWFEAWKPKPKRRKPPDDKPPGPPAFGG